MLEAAVDAIGQAADCAGARIVFATVPKSWIPYWQEFQMHRLRQALAHAQRQLVELPAHAEGESASGEFRWTNGEESGEIAYQAAIATPGAGENAVQWRYNGVRNL
jgi:hypothetical protein